MLLVNARLLFISEDVWYRRLPNNTTVLTVGTNIALLLTIAYRLRLTTINRDRTRNKTIKKTYIYKITLIFSNIELTDLICTKTRLISNSILVRTLMEIVMGFPRMTSQSKGGGTKSFLTRVHNH